MKKNLKKQQRKNDNNVTLISVISNVKNIADEQYDGMVYDHILTIFNKLSTKEKRVLLRGLINIVFIVEDKVVLNSTDLDHIRDFESIKDKHNTENNKVEKQSNEKDIILNDDFLEEIKKASEKANKGPTHDELNEELTKIRKLFLKLGFIMLSGIIMLIMVMVTEFNPEVYDSITKGIVKALKYIILF